MEKRVLLIDMYGVILKESKGNFIPYTLMHFPVAEYGRLLGAIREERLFTRAQNGEIGSEEFLSHLGYESPVETMEDYLKHWLTLDEGFKPFAESWRKTYPQNSLVLLSNDVAQWNAYLMELHGLKEYFVDAVVSGQVCMRKPQPEIFQYTLERLGCAAGDCIFVDNSASNLRAARQLGIDTVHFNRDGEDYEGRQAADFGELGHSEARAKAGLPKGSERSWENRKEWK